MAESPRSGNSNQRFGNQRDAVERLYVYWMVSTALLLLVLVVVVIMTRGMLQRQALNLRELENRVLMLEALTQRDPTVPPQKPTPSDARQQSTVDPAHDAAAAANQTSLREPEEDAAPEPVSDEPAVAVIPAEDEILAWLDRAVERDPVTPLDLRDATTADELVTAALKVVERARWAGATWARLAVVARLVGRDTAADSFARRADQAGASLVPYAEVVTRDLLAARRASEAMPFVSHLEKQTRASALSQVLLAAVYLQTDERAAADQAVMRIDELDDLSVRDRLLLARVLLDLQRWEALDMVMASIDEAPAPLAAERSYLQAIAYTRAGRTVEALAVLDSLAADLEEGSLAPTPAPPAEPWGAPAPSGYEIAVWRGVTLLEARQIDAAREALRRAAENAPQRPLAHYYLGRLEIDAGRHDLAENHLLNATACDADFAPAWESLAVLALNRDQIDDALAHLEEVVRINPRRASAHFAQAIAHAKRSEGEPAGAALRKAFQYQPRYLEEAKHTEVLLRLFSPDQLDQMAQEGPISATQPADGSESDVE